MMNGNMPSWFPVPPIAKGPCRCDMPPPCPPGCPPRPQPICPPRPQPICPPRPQPVCPDHAGGEELCVRVLGSDNCGNLILSVKRPRFCEANGDWVKCKRWR